MSSIQVSFQAGGVESVLQAIASVDKALAKMMRGVVRAGQSTEQSVRHTGQVEREETDKTEKYKLRVQLGTAKLTSQLIDKQLRESKRAQDKEMRDREAAERYKIAVQIQSAKIASKAAEQQAREAKRLEDKEVNDRVSSEEKKIAAIKRAEQKAAAEREKSERQSIAVQRRSAQMASDMMDRQARETRAARQSIASSAGSFVGRSVRNTFSTAASMAGGLMALGGGFSIADAVGSEIRTRGIAKDIELRSNKAVTAGQIHAAAAASATQYGFKTEDVLETANEFVKKSGAGGAVLGILPKLVEMASASGASLGDIGTMAAKFQMMTGNSGQTMELMRTVVGAGRVGSIDISDLGQYGARIAGASSMFQDKVGAAKFFTGMIQQTASTGGATDAAEATMSIGRLSEAFVKRRNEIKAITGVNPMDKAGVMLADPRNLILQILRKTAGKSGGVSDLFEGEREKRALRGYENVYKRSFEEAGGKAGVPNKQAEEKATQAVLDAFAVFDKAVLSETQVREEAAERAKEIDRQIESVMNHFRTVIGDELIPVIGKLTPKIAELIPAFSKMLKDIVDHPMVNIGELIAAKIATDAAGAALGKGIEKVVAQGLLLAFGSAAGITVTTLVATIAAAGFTFKSLMGSQEAGKTAVANEMTIENEIKSAMNMPGGPERPAKIKAVMDKVKDAYDKRMEDDPSDTFGNKFFKLLDKRENEEEDQGVHATNRTMIKSLMDDFVMLNDELNKTTRAFNAITGAADNVFGLTWNMLAPPESPLSRRGRRE